MSLDTLKRANTLDKLLSQVQAESAPQEKKSYVDERLWKPELDKSGNGYAVIRFLPAPTGEAHVMFSPGVSVRIGKPRKA